MLMMQMRVNTQARPCKPGASITLLLILFFNLIVEKATGQIDNCITLFAQELVKKNLINKNLN